MSQSRSEIFRLMAEQDPGNEMIWYGLGTEYLKEERWAEAASALRQVIELKPDYTAAYQMLGTALAASGETEAARQVWTKGVTVAHGGRTGDGCEELHVSCGERERSAVPSVYAASPVVHHTPPEHPLRRPLGGLNRCSRG